MANAPRLPASPASRAVDAAIGAVGLALTALLVFADVGNERERERRAFERTAESLVADLSRVQAEQTRNDQTVADLFEASEVPSEDRFVKFAASHPPASRRAIQFVPRVRDADRARFEAQLGEAHPDGVGIWEPGEDGERRPAAPRPDYFPVQYMYPVAEMESVFGFDLGSEPLRRLPLEQAARTGLPTISMPIRLVEAPNRWAYLRYVPLYRQGHLVGTPDEREEALRGFVVAVYRFGDSLDAAMESTGASHQVVYLYAEDRPDALPVYTYRTPDAAPDASAAPRLAEAAALPGTVVSHFHLTDRDRVHVFVPSPPTPIWRLADRSTAIITLLGLALTTAALVDRRLRRRREQLEKVELDIAHVLSECTDLEEGARRVLGVIGIQLAWDHAELQVAGDRRRGDGGTVVWPDGSDLLPSGDPPHGAGPRETSTVSTRAGHLRKIEWIEDLHGSGADETAAMIGAGLRSTVTLPLISENRVLGIVTLASRAPRPPEPDTAAMLADAGAGIGQLVARMLAQDALRDEHDSLALRVDERTAELRQANADLARAGRMKHEFLASMSHELRTPLNAVLGLSEALQERVYGPLTESQERSLRTIEESGRKLLGLINDILDLSKIEAGKLNLQKASVEVAGLCQSALHLVRPAAQEKGHALTLSVEPAGLRTYADSRRLKQILVNLLSNAVKFTDPGGSIALEAAGGPGSVRFTVRDNGIGIAEADRPQLFKPFVQLDSSLARRHEGSGLGLALVGRLAELHGGKVELESEPGRGTTVSVTVPGEGPGDAGPN